MKRVALVGVGPMPAPGRTRLYAPGLRLEAFLGALLRAGVTVHLAEISFAAVDEPFQPRTAPGIEAHIHLGAPGDPLATRLQELFHHWQPDAVVALTDIGALTVTRTSYLGPLHVDYFGHPMAERAQLGAAHDSDASLAAQWLDVLPVLLRADRFSACSNPQRCALLGELGAVGRLNSRTTEYNFVEIVPPTLPFDTPLPQTDPDPLATLAIPSNARIILSTGGFNTWFDADTLFRALEIAMARDPGLYFVCTGGAIDGHVTIVYDRFLRNISESPIRDRCHLLGWVPQETWADLLLSATVAVNSDTRTYEGEFGCRNRLYGWLWAGLRVVSTISSEPTRHLADQKWIRPVPERSPEEMATALLEETARGRRQNIHRVHEKLRRQWGPDNFFQDLAEWVRVPRIAPDREPGQLPTNPLADLHRTFLASHTSNAATDPRTTARQLAARLRGSRLYSLYGRLHPETDALLRQLEDL